MLVTTVYRVNFLSTSSLSTDFSHLFHGQKQILNAIKTSKPEISSVFCFRTKMLYELQAVTISANAWSEAGHAVNHVYDLLYMMNRDDVAVGVGGDGGISDDGSIIFPDVGGFLPLIEQVHSFIPFDSPFIRSQIKHSFNRSQGMSTVGDCRYRQAIPVGSRGRLDIDTNYGLRRAFLPQGKRRYVPLHQPTAQRVMLETISAGPTTLFLIGSHTNAALFLMTNPRWKKNIDHIYIMGGGIRSENPTGCCPADHSSSCIPLQCGDHGNLFTAYATNPFAEFNIFSDPFAACQVRAMCSYRSL